MSRTPPIQRNIPTACSQNVSRILRQEPHANRHTSRRTAGSDRQKQCANVLCETTSRSVIFSCNVRCREAITAFRQAEMYGSRSVVSLGVKLQCRERYTQLSRGYNIAFSMRRMFGPWHGLVMDVCSRRGARYHLRDN